MAIEFKKVSEFPRGTIFDLLTDAYSYDDRNGACWSWQWREFDDFFYDNLEIADQCGFITTLDGEPIGMASWDPRNRPEYVEVGHNCILCKYKGRGYGKMQLQEAVNRILQYDIKKIIVNTNATFVPAMHNYQSVGFKECQRRKNDGVAAYTGDYVDYEYIKSVPCKVDSATW